MNPRQATGVYSLEFSPHTHAATAMSESDEPQAENSKIELAKALLAVRSVATNDVFEAVRSLLIGSGPADGVDQAVEGLSKEDEFALMCRLMGTATHLTHLEQRPVIIGDYLVPDFLASFRPGCTPGRKIAVDAEGFRCLVEVKSTSKDKFKIGGHKLRRLRAYAAHFGLPLVFAVRFLRFGEHALWIMVEDDLSKNSITVTYARLADGVRHVLWDDYMLMVYPWIAFRAVYDTATDPDIGVRHAQYGAMREFHIVSHPDHPIAGPTVSDNAARFDGVTALTLSAFFEGFRPEAVAVRQEGTVTVQLLKPTVPCSIADMVYSFNRLPRDEHGRALFDPSRILTGADSDAALITRQFIDRITADLWHSVLGILTFGEPELQLQKWERLCRGPKGVVTDPSSGSPQQGSPTGR